MGLRSVDNNLESIGEGHVYVYTLSGVDSESKHRVQQHKKTEVQGFKERPAFCPTRLAQKQGMGGGNLPALS